MARFPLSTLLYVGYGIKLKRKDANEKARNIPSIVTTRIKNTPPLPARVVSSRPVPLRHDVVYFLTSAQKQLITFFTRDRYEVLVGFNVSKFQYSK